MQRVTIQMIKDWSQEAGEDFIDYHEHILNGVTLSSFMAGHRKKIARPLWKEMNETISKKSRYSIQQTLEIYEELFTTTDETGFCDYKGEELFYEDFVRVINTTEGSRKRVLDALLGVGEEE